MPRRAAVGVETMLEFTLFTPSYRTELIGALRFTLLWLLCGETAPQLPADEGVG